MRNCVSNSKALLVFGVNLKRTSIPLTDLETHYSIPFQLTPSAELFSQMVAQVKLAKSKLPSESYVRAFIPELLVMGKSMQTMGEELAARAVFFSECSTALAPLVMDKDGNAQDAKTPSQLKLLTLYVQSMYGTAMSSLQVARRSDPRISYPQTLKEVLSVARQIVRQLFYTCTCFTCSSPTH